ncbi:MAG: AHH domain-containing protein [Deltaproteobacteria bacterium]|jgi:hypothetical protein|nr:AHH domain-containing protein [Deltaproteobacteria bacterium]
MSDVDHPEVVLNGERNLITNRQGGYRGKVGAQGYVGANNQVHHVLPCGASTKSKNEFLEGQPDPGTAERLLEQTTHWDVNDKPNLIGLPTRVVYAVKFGTPFGIAPPTPLAINPAVACNLPIHLWNHAEYSKVAKKLADKVWAKANLKIETHKDGKATLSASDVKGWLQAISDQLRACVAAPTRKRTKEAWRSGNREVFQIYPFVAG